MTQERVIEYEVDGVEYICEEGALAALLDSGDVFVSACEAKCTLFVGFNDVFWWASADGEDLLLSEVPDVYRAWKRNNKWGVIRWAALKRKMRPQWPMAVDMIAEGAWDSELNALPSRLEDRSDHGWTAEHERYATEHVTT